MAEWTTYWRQQRELWAETDGMNRMMKSTCKKIRIFTIYAQIKNYEKAKTAYEKLEEDIFKTMEICDIKKDLGLLTDGEYIVFCNTIKQLNDVVESYKKYFDEYVEYYGIN